LRDENLEDLNYEILQVQLNHQTIR